MRRNLNPGCLTPEPVPLTSQGTWIHCDSSSPGSPHPVHSFYQAKSVSVPRCCSEKGDLGRGRWAGPAALVSLWHALTGFRKASRGKFGLLWVISEHCGSNIFLDCLLPPPQKSSPVPPPRPWWCVSMMSGQLPLGLCSGEGHSHLSKTVVPEFRHFLPTRTVVAISANPPVTKNIIYLLV